MPVQHDNPDQYAYADCLHGNAVSFANDTARSPQMQQRFGTAIHVLRETGSRDLDLDHLEELLSTNPVADDALTLVSITHIPTSSGRIYDAEGVGAVVTRHPGAQCMTVLRVKPTLDRVNRACSGCARR